MTPESLDAEIAGLPESIEPPTELWPRIEAAIESPTRRRRWAPRVGGLLAAAMVVLAIGVALGRHLGPVPPATASHPPRPVQMRAAHAALEEAVRDRKDLDPNVLAEIERNLALIDQAIADCEQALAENPDDPGLTDALVVVWRARLDLLTQTQTLYPNTLAR